VENAAILTIEKNLWQGKENQTKSPTPTTNSPAGTIYNNANSLLQASTTTTFCKNHKTISLMDSQQTCKS